MFPLFPVYPLMPQDCFADIVVCEITRANAAATSAECPLWHAGKDPEPVDLSDLSGAPDGTPGKTDGGRIPIAELGKW